MPGWRLRVSTEGGEWRVADSSDMTKTSSGPLGFARMTGSSIVARDAAVWVTDFLNAAYYRRVADEREVDDLRLAFCILTTYWHRHGSCIWTTLRRSIAPSARRGSRTAGR